MNIFLGGINGVGKTTVIHKVKAFKPELVTVDGAKEFMQWLGLGDDYVKLRALDNITTNQKLTEFITQFIKSHSDKDILYSGHYLNLVRGEIKDVMLGGWPALFDKLVLLTTPPDQIYNRLKNDQLRDRALSANSELPEIKQIESYQNATIAHAQKIADKFNKPLEIILNEDGKFDNVIESIKYYFDKE